MMPTDKNFELKVITEITDNTNSVFINQEVTFILTIRNEDGAAVDLTEASATNQIILKRVGGTKKTFTATFVGDGTDGEVKYTTVAADIDITGMWRVQFIHTKASGEDLPSEIVMFNVLPRL